MEGGATWLRTTWISDEALWLSGWFALLAARFQVAKLNGPRLHRLAIAIAAAGTAASLFWLGSLIQVGKHLWALDSGRLLSGGVSAGLVRWTAAPLAVGAALAIAYFVLMLRWRSEPTEEEAVASETEVGDAGPGRAGDVSPPSPSDEIGGSRQRMAFRSAELTYPPCQNQPIAASVMLIAAQADSRRTPPFDALALKLGILFAGFNGRSVRIVISHRRPVSERRA